MMTSHFRTLSRPTLITWVKTDGERHDYYNFDLQLGGFAIYANFVNGQSSKPRISVMPKTNTCYLYTNIYCSLFILAQNLKYPGPRGFLSPRRDKTKEVKKQREKTSGSG